MYRWNISEKKAIKDISAETVNNTWNQIILKEIYAAFILEVSLDQHSWQNQTHCSSWESWKKINAIIFNFIINVFFVFLSVTIQLKMCLLISCCNKHISIQSCNISFLKNAKLLRINEPNVFGSLKWKVSHIYTTEQKMHIDHGRQITMDVNKAILKDHSFKSLY